MSPRPVRLVRMPLRKSVAISRSDSSSFRDWMNFCVRVFAGSGRSTRMHVPGLCRGRLVAVGEHERIDVAGAGDGGGQGGGGGHVHLLRQIVAVH